MLELTCKGFIVYTLNVSELYILIAYSSAVTSMLVLTPEVGDVTCKEIVFPVFD